MPAATEEVKLDNDLVFSVGSKMFCICSLDQPFKCSFKLRDDEYDQLSATEGYMPAQFDC